VLVTVDLAVIKVVLICEVCLERQMLSALFTLEALLVEDHLVDRSDLLHLVDAIPASRALVGRRRREQVPQSLRRRVRRRDGGRRRRNLSRRHG